MAAWKTVTTPPSSDTTARAAASAAQGTADAAVPKAGGTMTGALTLSGAPTSDLHAATKLYVQTIVNALVNGAPGTLDTLKEIADQLAADESAAAALTAAVAGKYSKPGAGIPIADLAFDPATQAELDVKPTIYVQLTQPTGAPANSLWIKLNGDGTLAPIDQWQVFN